MEKHMDTLRTLAQIGQSLAARVNAQTTEHGREYWTRPLLKCRVAYAAIRKGADAVETLTVLRRHVGGTEGFEIAALLAALQAPAIRRAA